MQIEVDGVAAYFCNLTVKIRNGLHHITSVQYLKSK